ncbi:class I SAM-dependent methyltransferase [Alkalicoccobacillus plakortidis]|uniref:Methyltransferase domain-containing protein n=1 Tax=Alkalicoccobacillus plakortidis TaxID=444060 RepID=A0ABT0XNJ6_9BACI|nr:rRNA adenine N-6-methyltransferase family protein [Alkalicoccobacillus plakortidis]MCM2677483.1 methyltransferase domain-containing protein [Alkalicoccobacillus plakortidis]
MRNIKFLTQYITNPRTVGAVLPSSKYLSYKMLDQVNFKTANCIIEYGSGTGAFTKEILKRRKKETTIVLVEYNKEFFNILKENFENEPNLFIINDSAENIEKHLNDLNITSVDFIVSGLPFASLPTEMSDKILTNTLNILNQNGLFITFQYTKLKIAYMERFFPHIQIEKEYRNVPPAYILSCKK